ncbi:hypothetical protein F25303_9885 [Fusarium sp. NRRL 25303]|nr:hypothetical protein F25303_9885 [Fusarium sp. NRRL 25303]
MATTISIESPVERDPDIEAWIGFTEDAWRSRSLVHVHDRQSRTAKKLRKLKENLTSSEKSSSPGIKKDATLVAGNYCQSIKWKRTMLRDAEQQLEKDQRFNVLLTATNFRQEPRMNMAPHTPRSASDRLGTNVWANMPGPTRRLDQVAAVHTTVQSWGVSQNQENLIQDKHIQFDRIASTRSRYL